MILRVDPPVADEASSQVRDYLLFDLGITPDEAIPAAIIAARLMLEQDLSGSDASTALDEALDLLDTPSKELLDNTH